MLGAVLLIVSPSSVVSRFLLSNRPMVWIGLISYPLYLWHWPLLSYLGIIRHGVPTLIEIWIALIVAFILAWLTYRLVEMPLRRRPECGAATVFRIDRRRRGRDRNDRQPAGFGFRFPQEIRDIALFPPQSNAGLRDQCFLESPGAQFNSNCIEPGDKPLLLLWGDSSAAALLPGFEKGPAVRSVSSGAFRRTGLRADPGGRVELQMRCGQ